MSTANITPERLAEMSRRVGERQSINQIMREMGTGSGTIKRHFPDYQGRRDLRGSNDKTTKANRLEQIKQMLDDGASVNETARTLGACHKTIKKHFPEAGWGPGGGAAAGEYRKLLKKLDEMGGML